MEKIMFILRGLPGTGKTTLANAIKNLNQDNVNIHAIDDYFYQVDEYVYEEYLIPIAIEVFREKVKLSIKNECPFIVLHNTHSRLGEFSELERIAKENGYTVIVSTMDAPEIIILCERLNKEIPIDKIKKMKARWEFRQNPKPFSWYFYRFKKFFRKLRKKITNTNS